MKKIFFYYLAPVFFVGAYLFLMYSWPFMHLQNIKITGVEKSNQNFIFNLINKELSQKYFYILAVDHIFFYPQQKIKNEIITNIPRIKDVQFLSKNWWQELEIKIIEREEKYLWCQKIEVEKCFYMDNFGIIFTPLDKKNNKKFLKFYGPIKQEKFIDVTKIINLFKKNNLMVEKIIIDKFYNYVFILKDNTKILLSSDFDLKIISNYLNIIFTYHDFKIDQKNNKFIKKINYINLMFGNKIYYCLNNEKCANNY